MKAIDIYGELNQKVVAIEELAELQKEICKDLRGKGNRINLTEELADVEIMLEQLKEMYLIDTQALDLIKRQKLERLDKRINKDIKERYGDDN